MTGKNFYFVKNVSKKCLVYLKLRNESGD
jgi:hypothetical protein